MARPGRRGNILLVIAIFGTIIFLAVWSLGFLTRTDASTTANLLRELQATYLAESIAAQVDVQANSHPWNERFWVGPTSTTASLNRSSAFVNLSGETLPSGDWDFTGVVKDLPDRLRQYRLYLEVTVRGETYCFTWDKRHEQTLLTGLGEDATETDKTLDAPGPASATDTLLDGIKTQEVSAPATDNSGSGQQQRLGKLRKDRPSHRARALLPDSGGQPADPQDVISSVNGEAQKLPVKQDPGKGGKGK